MPNLGTIRAPPRSLPLLVVGIIGQSACTWICGIRHIQLYLTNQKKLSTSSILIVLAALRFLYKVTLKRDWSLADAIPIPKKPKKLPVILSPQEVRQFLESVKNREHHAILTTCYAAGLRISEAVALRPHAIDSQRMVIRVEQGKGR
jgi:site-specific recombinase XerD